MLIETECFKHQDMCLCTLTMRSASVLPLPLACCLPRSESVIPLQDRTHGFGPRSTRNLCRIKFACDKVISKYITCHDPHPSLCRSCVTRVTRIRRKICRYWLEGRQLRSNFGTTKYCATYLRNAPCSNPDCLYLHELGEEEDRFTKEEIQQRSLLAPPIPPGAATVTGGGGPSGSGMRCNSPFLPPPVYESAANGAGAGGGGATLRSHHAQQAQQAHQAKQAREAQQAQQAAAAGAAAAAASSSAHRGVGRGAKPSGQVSLNADSRILQLSHATQLPVLSLFSL